MENGKMFMRSNAFKRSVRYVSFMFVLLVLAGCEYYEVPVPLSGISDCGFVVAYAGNKSSELVLMDQQGRITGSQEFPKSSITKLERASDKGIAVLSDHKLYTVDKKGKATLDEDIGRYGEISDLYVYKDDILTSYAYGTSGKIEVKGKNRKISGEDVFEPVKAVAMDNNNIYYITEREIKAANGEPLKNEVKFFVVVRKYMKIIEIIHLDAEFVEDMQLDDSTILVITQRPEKKLVVINKENWKVNYLDIPYDNPNALITDDNNMYLAFPGGKISVFGRRTFKHKGDIKTGTKIIRLRMDHKNLYVLSEKELIPNYLYFDYSLQVYSKETRKLIRTIPLPELRDQQLVDFLPILPD